MPAFAPPEQGNLVEVRQRHFLVVEVQQSTLPPDPLRRNSARPQHLVTLASVDEEALGEEVQVVWELEPSARTVEKDDVPRPAGFDAPERLDAFLDAVRWGVASSADVRALLSLFRSGIEIEDYQLDPVVRAIQMPRVNLLLADDVGLGKTIEAGLVCQELILRHRARKVLIVCPASLQLQWRDQMREKFGLEFRIVDADALWKSLWIVSNKAEYLRLQDEETRYFQFDPSLGWKSHIELDAPAAPPRQPGAGSVPAPAPKALIRVLGLPPAPDVGRESLLSSLWKECCQ